MRSAMLLPTPVIVNYAQTRGRIATTAEAVISVTPTARDGVEGARMVAALDHAEGVLRNHQHHADVLTAPDDRMASLLQSFVAARALEAGKVDVLPGQRTLEAKFDPNDWAGWVGSFFTWVRGLRPHPWIPAPSVPDTFPNHARIAVLGDWGTGLYGAPVCASAIERDAHPLDLVIHLGDVYYSGTSREVGERFIALWPRRTDALSRAVNSNHEMYSGGHAYFDITLRVFRQSSSVFVLRNDHWLLIGLDTAYAEHDLAEDQAGWVNRLCDASEERRVIFFSHHQPFSLFEKGGEKLLAHLADLIATRRIFAWYWGHEHRCVIFDRDPESGFHGRCVGHSGFPYFRDSFDGVNEAHRVGDHVFYRFGPGRRGPGGIVLDGDNGYVPGHEREYGPHGYMTIELDGPRLHERVHAADGDVLWEQTIS